MNGYKISYHGIPISSFPRPFVPPVHCHPKAGRNPRSLYLLLWNFSDTPDENVIHAIENIKKNRADETDAKG